MESKQETPTTIRLGISSCLLGQEVRYNGGHKHDPFLTGTLGKYLEFIPVCPEVEAGMGTPRETVRLEGSPHSPRMIGSQTRTDWTDHINLFSQRRVKGLAGFHLHGYILKKNSPSCGVERVRVYDDRGLADRKGRGLFAAALLKRFPLLPVEEEDRLHDMTIRENFLERVFAYQRWTTLLARRPSPSDLASFHSRHKCTLLSHSPEAYRKLRRLLEGGIEKTNGPQLIDKYGPLFMSALKVRATPRKHADVLFHLLGYLKKALDAPDREEATRCIEQYRQGLMPLLMPLTLLQHHFRRHPVDWVNEQTYLNPHPAELMLRNHV